MCRLVFYGRLLISVTDKVCAFMDIRRYTYVCMYKGVLCVSVVYQSKGHRF